MSKPVCFVIMGFGLKTDYSLGKTYDLDKTYKNIIKPAVTAAGYICVRADEIKESGIIDKSMYALLLKADLVIADITTYNPNAVYELGVRHGVRPFSTIVLKEQESKIEFDFSHERIFKYKHLGEDIGVDEAEKCKKRLSDLIKTIQKTPSPDSPLYEFIKSARPATYDDEEFRDIIDRLQNNENSLFDIVEKAKKEMADKKFAKASENWKKANEIAIDESYYIQQQALSHYKSNPEDSETLYEALYIIKQLKPDESADPETLGITGAIYKNLYLLNKRLSDLEKAIQYYGKGYSIIANYYNGENYAICLNMKAKSAEKGSDEEIALKYQAKDVCKKIISNLENIEKEELAKRSDIMWIYATLSNCWLYLGDFEKAVKYEELFLEQNPKSWQIETFEATKQQLKDQ